MFTQCQHSRWIGAYLAQFTSFCMYLFFSFGRHSVFSRLYLLMRRCGFGYDRCLHSHGTTLSMVFDCVDSGLHAAQLERKERYLQTPKSSKLLNPEIAPWGGMCLITPELQGGKKAEDRRRFVFTAVFTGERVDVCPKARQEEAVANVGGRLCLNQRQALTNGHGIVWLFHLMFFL